MTMNNAVESVRVRKAIELFTRIQAAGSSSGKAVENSHTAIKRWITDNEFGPQLVTVQDFILLLLIRVSSKSATSQQ